MSEAYFPDDLRLRTYAGLSETLRLEQALRTTLLTLAPVLPADGVFVNFFMKDELVVQFLAHATKARAEAMTARVPVSHDWLLKMSYERRGQCLVVNERREDPLTDEVLRNVLPEVRSYVMLRLLMDGIHYGVLFDEAEGLRGAARRHRAAASQSDRDQRGVFACRVLQDGWAGDERREPASEGERGEGVGGAPEGASREVSFARVDCAAHQARGAL